MEENEYVVRGRSVRGRVRRDVFLVVGICSAQSCAGRRQAVRETWLRHPREGVECLFFLGGDVPAGEEGDTVGLDAPDSYNDLPAKVLAFFRYALEYYDFEWLFKCDDDTYLDLSRLPELADSRYGMIGDVSVEQRGAPSGGAGYLLSREIVEKIAFLPEVTLTGAEDLIFGRLALEAGAVPHATPRLFMANVCYPAPDNDQVSAHWCKPETLRAMDVLRHGSPSAVYRGHHQHWEDRILFYREGVFRRENSPDYGWWQLDGDELTLAWKRRDAYRLVWEERSFRGVELELEKEMGSRSLWELGPMMENRTPETRTADMGSADSAAVILYKILVVSLPDSPKRETMAQRLGAQGLSWEWVDGVRIERMEDMEPEEYRGLEAYCVPRLKEDPVYVCRAVGCKRAMRKALDRAKTEAVDWVIIFQDDAAPVEGFPQKLEELLKRVPRKAGCVMLHREGEGVQEKDGWIQVTGNVRSMTAFAVRPAFAEIMSRFLSRFNGEDDRIWEPLAREGEMILCAQPLPVHASHKGSDIIGGIPELAAYWN
nr:hypothetical protein [Akkermansia sp. B2-R-115]